MPQAAACCPPTERPITAGWKRKVRDAAMNDARCWVDRLVRASAREGDRQKSFATSPLYIFSLKDFIFSINQERKFLSLQPTYPYKISPLRPTPVDFFHLTKVFPRSVFFAIFIALFSLSCHF